MRINDDCIPKGVITHEDSAEVCGADFSPSVRPALCIECLKKDCEGCEIEVVKTTECLECVIDDKRKIQVYPSDHSGWLNFTFYNDDLETRLSLSREAVQAIHSLWFELERKGLAV